MQSDFFIRLREVKRVTGLSRSSIYERMKAGDFPKNYGLGARSRGWKASEIDHWMQSRSH